MCIRDSSDTVLIIDAVRSLHPPGTIHHFRADGISGAAANGIALGGGHLLGLGEAIDLARALCLLPRDLDVVGIEGADFELGQGLSAPVASACDLATAQLVDQLEQLLLSLVSRSGAAARPAARR